ncbi:MAG TPA: DUF2911 domain-containing protein [Chitinophagaceae bacterium]
MKSLLFFAAICFSIVAFGQTETAKRPSPPASVTQTIENGATIIIHYSQPSVKGRTIGKDLEPLDGKVWRTGANEATTFEVNKDVQIEGKTLPAGKYGLFTVTNGNEWTVIFNKTWNQWGAFNYKEADDVLRVKADRDKADSFSEQLIFTVGKNGEVTLLWGDNEVEFKVK